MPMKLTTQLMKWETSKYILNCNTQRRRWSLGNTACADKYWDKKDNAYLTYYAVVVDTYIEMQGAEQCVIDIYEQQYTAAKKAYDSFNSNFSGILAISSFLIALIA